MSKTRAFLIETNGSAGYVTYDGYNEMKGIFKGGYIEAVRFGPDAVAFCDEDGKMKGLERNRLATDFAKFRGVQMLPNDHFVGPVLLVGPPDENGDETSVPQSVTDDFSRM